MDHLLADKRKKYHVRGVTRSVSSPKAKSLADRGVEVVEGDLGHKDTLVKVRPACLQHPLLTWNLEFRSWHTHTPSLKVSAPGCNAGFQRCGRCLHLDRLPHRQDSGEGVPTGKECHRRCEGGRAARPSQLPYLVEPM